MKKRILAVILTILTLITCILITSCSSKKEAPNNQDADENDDTHSQFFDDVPDVAFIDGTPLVSNVSYNIGSTMVFATPTALSQSANEGITLKAVIEPSFATKTDVDWSVAFKNPESEWATGKNVTDYIKITPTSNGALTAKLECLQAFGEQVVVKVASRENPDVFDECTLEYMRRVENVVVKIGDDITLTPGVNYVDFEVARTNRGKGGAVSFEATFTDVYTIESWAGERYDPSDFSQWGLIGGNTSLSSSVAENTFVGIADGKTYTGKANFCYGELGRTKELYFDVDCFASLGAYLIQESGANPQNIQSYSPELLTKILTSAKTRGTDTLFWIEVIHPSNKRIHFEIKIGELTNGGVSPVSISLNMEKYTFNSTEEEYLKG